MILKGRGKALWELVLCDTSWGLQRLVNYIQLTWPIISFYDEIEFSLNANVYMFIATF